MLQQTVPPCKVVVQYDKKELLGVIPVNKFLNKKALIAISSILVALSITIIYITLIQSNKYNYDETIQQDLERELNLATESKKITMDDIKEYL